MSGGAGFADLVAAFLRDEHEASPVTASHLGLTEYDERADDLSESAFTRRTRASTEWLARFETVPDAALDASARIDWKPLECAAMPRIGYVRPLITI